MWEPVIIPVRSRSNRLSNKPQLRLGKTRNMLTHVLLRCLEFQFRPIVATTCSEYDDEVWSTAVGMNVSCHRGPHDDVLKRLLYAAKQYNVKDGFAIVNVDQPFFDPQLVRAMYGQLHACDVVLPDTRLYAGSHDVAISLDALERSVGERDEITDYETSWRDLDPELEVLNIGVPQVSKEEHRIVLDVDMPQDYWLAATVMDILGPSCQREDIIELFDRNPDMHRFSLR